MVPSCRDSCERTAYPPVGRRAGLAGGLDLSSGPGRFGTATPIPEREAFRPIPFELIMWPVGFTVARGDFGMVGRF